MDMAVELYVQLHNPTHKPISYHNSYPKMNKVWVFASHVHRSSVLSADLWTARPVVESLVGGKSTRPG